MVMLGPSLAIFSSKEALPVAQRLKMSFQANWLRLRGSQSHVRIWDELFPVGSAYFEALARVQADFAVVIFTGDDVSMVRNESLVVPRDNVIFELGFFSAKLPAGHVILLAERGIKVPTDYAGIKALPFNKLSWSEARDGTANPLDPCGVELAGDISAKWGSERVEAHSTTPPPPPPSSNIPLGGRLVPVYRDVESADDWFALLEQSLRRAQPNLDSKMLYFGPGAAAGWVHTTKSVDAFTHLLNTFNERIVPLLRHVSSEQELTLVDLGVGDLAPGIQVLNYCLQRRKRKLSYVAVDISYEMLKIAFKNGGPSLGAVHGTNGRVLAINTEFASLNRYRGLFGPAGSNLFLLLGNTLGNEASESVTLKNLFRAMSAGDKMILEYQAVEEDPVTAAELTALFSARRSFFMGPFTSLNCPADAIEFVVVEDPAEARNRGVEATTFKFVCRFRRDVELMHYGFAEPVLVPKGDVCVYLVRKYQDDAVPRLLEHSGFVVDENVVVPAVGSESDGPKRRRFGYLVATKPEGRGAP
jgi:hypothetical protein